MLNGPYVVGVGVFEEKERSDLREVWDSRFIFISAGRLRRGISQPAELQLGSNPCLQLCSTQHRLYRALIASIRYCASTQPYGQGD